MEMCFYGRMKSLGIIGDMKARTKDLLAPIHSEER